MTKEHWLFRELEAAIVHEFKGSVADTVDAAMELSLRTNPMARAMLGATLRVIARESAEIAERLLIAEREGVSRSVMRELAEATVDSTVRRTHYARYDFPPLAPDVTPYPRTRTSVLAATDHEPGEPEPVPVGMECAGGDE